MYVGSKVKQLRKQQRMTLSTLSEKSGVQIATLSRIEHQKMKGTLDSHINIAQALGIDVTQLYSDIIREDNPAEVNHRDSSSEVFTPNKGASFETLTNNIKNKKMIPNLLTISPGCCTDKDQNAIGCEKFIYVLEGNLNIDIAGKTYELHKENSLHFNASLEHTFSNIGDTPLKALCIISQESI